MPPVFHSHRVHLLFVRGIVLDSSSHCGTQPLDSVFRSVPALDDRVHWMDV